MASQVQVIGPNSVPGTAFTTILLADDIQPGEEPSYELCKLIYLYHPLGQKMVEAPIRMAQFKPRDVVVPDSPEDVVKDQFLKEWEEFGTEAHIANLATLARVYGIATVGLLHKNKDPDKEIDFWELANADVAVNVWDPLNTAGSLVLNQDPNAIDFLKWQNVRVAGKTYHRSRTCVLMNEKPIYISFTSSSFGFVGRSVYQRALFPLKSFIRSMFTDDLVATKAGVLIAKIKPPGSIIDNLISSVFGQRREMVKEAQTYNVISIGTDEEIESLNLQNIDGAMKQARDNILENIASADDMPAKILKAETFAEGFGEGTEDAEYIAKYVDQKREWMKPAYVFFTKIVQHRAWNEDFYKTIQAQYPEEYKGVDYKVAFYKWQKSFSASWPSLREEPESEKIKVDDVRLKAVIAAVQVLEPLLDPENKAVLIEWVADIFNSIKRLFPDPLELDFDALREYEPEVQPGAEPKPGHPFAAQDSVHRAVEQLNDAIARLPEKVKPKQRLRITG